MGIDHTTPLISGSITRGLMDKVGSNNRDKVCTGAMLRRRRKIRTQRRCAHRGPDRFGVIDSQDCRVDVEIGMSTI